ncbi:FtsH protease activity modulator HflK [Butyrivibrio sp. YAB3001]|uniref:FtsH protease activity modulator HflK n=1 Tax=Butyrivibrio sp. YAB3001 TaxID=1520812 RepID=UPI0008F63729|nr:FtsH protease activity modulator HflK [Butyrivibrio sp. YAB3001]SFB72610.1 membrane protease subunit HflK [Butyrivibrio sp. YAB3001]
MFGKKGNMQQPHGYKDVAKKSPKLIIFIAIAIVLLFCVGESFYSVKEQEQAILTMFGKVLRVDTAGLYFKVPFIQDVHTIDMTTHGIGIGYTIKDGQNITVDDEGVMITSDFNFVDIDFYLEYKVSDPVAAYYNSVSPEVIMKNMALACIRNTVVNYKVDDVITTAKGQIQSEVKETLQKELTEKNIGMMVVNLSVQDAEPPTEEIVQAFKSVETAKQGKDTAVNNAKKYQSEELPKAEADADKIIQDAEAYKQARIAEAEGQVARFNEMYEQYKLQPYITKKRLFYETMEDVLPGLKVIISDGNTQQMLPLDSFSATE